jgi:prepilin-type N-terminal cleavage/methylation domain-containing protein/prepilin-type processing-associated H-X9-DG protein
MKHGIGYHDRKGASRPVAFTLVEVLVVITIIGVLIALLMPAVQAARETARQLQCRSNLKTIALGFLHHEEVTGRYPTGGWGCLWTGDADLGTDQRQPGGWVYNILPYIEQQALHDMGAGLQTTAKNSAHFQRMSVPLGLLLCPTRRQVTVAYPWPSYNGSGVNFLKPTVVSRTDYASNGGDMCLGDDCTLGCWVSMRNDPPGQYAMASGCADYGPASLADGGVNTSDGTKLAKVAYTFRLYAKYNTGIVSRGSVIRPTDVTDGTSCTYLAGEKFVGSDWYTTGQQDGDDSAALTGFEDDHDRFTGDISGTPGTSSAKILYGPPIQDIPGYFSSSVLIFGSPHTNGLHMAFCDGSVQLIAYTINKETHRRLGNRCDGLAVDDKTF